MTLAVAYGQESGAKLHEATTNSGTVKASSAVNWGNSGASYIECKTSGGGVVSLRGHDIGGKQVICWGVFRLDDDVDLVRKVFCDIMAGTTIVRRLGFLTSGTGAAQTVALEISDGADVVLHGGVAARLDMISDVRAIIWRYYGDLSVEGGQEEMQWRLADSSFVPSASDERSYYYGPWRGTSAIQDQIGGWFEHAAGDRHGLRGTVPVGKTAPANIDGFELKAHLIGGVKGNSVTIYHCDFVATDFGGLAEGYSMPVSVLNAPPVADVGSPHDNWSEFVAGGGKWADWDEIPGNEATDYLFRTGDPDPQLSELANHDAAAIVDTRGKGMTQVHGSGGFARRMVALQRITRRQTELATGTTITPIGRETAVAPVADTTLPIAPSAPTWKGNDTHRIRETPYTATGQWDMTKFDALEIGATTSAFAAIEHRVTNMVPMVVMMRMPEVGLIPCL